MKIDLWQQVREINAPVVGQTLLSIEEIKRLAEGTIICVQWGLATREELREIRHKASLIYAAPYSIYAYNPTLKYTWELTHQDIGIHPGQVRVWVPKEPELPESCDGEEIFITIDF